MMTRLYILLLTLTLLIDPSVAVRRSRVPKPLAPAAAAAAAPARADRPVPFPVMGADEEYTPLFMQDLDASEGSSTGLTADGYPRCSGRGAGGFASYTGWRVLGDDVSFTVSPVPPHPRSRGVPLTTSCPALCPSRRNSRVSAHATATAGRALAQSTRPPRSGAG